MILIRHHQSLNRYQVFEVAARHLSFSRAAKELNVLQPAVSRQIASLEAELEVSLFHRTKPQLTLTHQGESLNLAVANGLEIIHLAASNLRKMSKEDVVVVNAAIGFTSLYLLPRLGDFQLKHPNIKLQIVTRDQNSDFDLEECDCVVVFGTNGLKNMQSALVLKEELVPVCAPRYFQDGEPLALSELTNMNLLHLSSSDHADDWKIYLENTGLAVRSPPQENCFHSYMVYLHAIQNGNGIGLGWGKLIDSHLKNGTLELACNRRIGTTRGYYCNLTKRGACKPGAGLFMDWLMNLA